jgi:hypothetical protein
VQPSMIGPAPEEVRRAISSRERVLWWGRPRQGLVLRASDALAIPFSLMWGGFAIFWEMSVVSSNAPLFFMLWGVPFVLVGIYMVIGRFFFEAQQRARTYYAVTSERIVIVSGVITRTVKSLSLNTLTDVSLSEYRNGVGTITFGGQGALPSWFGNSGWPDSQAGPRFELVPDAKSVYESIRDAQRGSFVAAAP